MFNNLDWWNKLTKGEDQLFGDGCYSLLQNAYYIIEVQIGF